MDGLLVGWRRGWGRNGPTTNALRNCGHRHYEREALAVRLVLSAAGLSLAIGGSFLTLDTLRPVNVIGI
jgi:hypothetical protein